MATAKTAEKKALTAEEVAAQEEKAEAKRKKKAAEYVGCLVHFYPAPAEGYNEEESRRLEKERREADPLAAIITSVQPDGEEGQTIVNLQVFAPDGTSPSFGVDVVDGEGKGADGTPFCVLLA